MNARHHYDAAERLARSVMTEDGVDLHTADDDRLMLIQSTLLAAQVHATLALAGQQQVANLIAYWGGNAPRPIRELIAAAIGVDELAAAPHTDKS